MNRCILIKTKDNRSFLTHEKNLNCLIEFAKTFGAEMFTVIPASKSLVLDLEPLTSALCNPEYKDNPEYKCLKKIFPSQNRDRSSILRDAELIRSFIREKFISGESVSLKELKEMYKKHNLTDACLCNHMTSVRNTLTSEGYAFRKIGAGNYCLVK